MNADAHRNEDSAVLLQRCQQGDQEAARILFERYADRLIRMVNGRLRNELRPRLDADDIVQSAYRSFFRIAMEGQVKLEKTGALWRLLVAIALNKLRLRARYHYAEKRSPAKEQSVESAGPDKRRHEPFVDQQMPDEEITLLDELSWLMQQTSPLHQQILHLLLQGESVPTVGQRTGRTQRTVRRVLEKAIFTLKFRLNRLDDEDGTD